MIELYFLIYRIPKIMSALARERNRSAVAWSLIGIGSWLGAEIIVALALGIGYGICATLFGWPQEPPAVFVLLSYVVVLGAAICGVTIARRILTSKPDADSVILPPPPPRFQ
jgi:hypothetical protein